MTEHIMRIQTLFSSVITIHSLIQFIQRKPMAGNHFSVKCQNCSSAGRQMSQLEISNLGKASFHGFFSQFLQFDPAIRHFQRWFEKGLLQFEYNYFRNTKSLNMIKAVRLIYFQQSGGRVKKIEICKFFFFRTTVTEMPVHDKYAQ